MIDEHQSSSFAATLVLQPGAEGKDSYVNWGNPDANFGNEPWFYGLGIITSRAAFIEFDLSSIPAGSPLFGH